MEGANEHGRWDVPLLTDELHRRLNAVIHHQGEQLMDRVRAKVWKFGSGAHLEGVKAPGNDFQVELILWELLWWHVAVRILRFLHHLRGVTLRGWIFIFLLQSCGGPALGRARVRGREVPWHADGSWQHYTDKLQSQCSLRRWTRCVQHYSSRSHLGQWCQIHHCRLAGFGMRCKHGSSLEIAGWAAGTPGRSAGWTSPTSQMRHRYSLFPEDQAHEWTGCSCAHLSRTCTAQDPLYDKHSTSTAQYALYDTKNRMIKHLRSMKARGNIENVVIVQDFGFFSTCPTIVQCSRNRGGEVRSCLETPDFPWLAPNK